jgi:uncharacterized protein (TIGR02246 family)
MNRHNRLFTLVLPAILAGLAATCLMRYFPTTQASGSGAQDEQPAAKVQGKDANEKDIAAIKKNMQSLIAAFEKADAKAVASHWTIGGEYIDDDGTKYHGREALEKAYAAFFKNNKNLKLAIEKQSLRFLSSNTAVEEGYLKLKHAKTADFVNTKFSALHVKEDGKWQIAIMREWPSEGISLFDLEWLIGTWQAKRDDMEVETTYEWAAKKKYIVMTFTIKDKNRTQKGKQFITHDASTGLLRSWTFEDDGDFGEAVWIREGKKWMIDASGVLESGATMTATNIMTPINEDTFLWQSVERTLDEEALPDVPPIKVTRVKSKKQAADD